jgi:hypothetical protein
MDSYCGGVILPAASIRSRYSFGTDGNLLCGIDHIRNEDCVINFHIRAYEALVCGLRVIPPAVSAGYPWSIHIKGILAPVFVRWNCSYVVAHQNNFGSDWFLFIY